jgi:CBS domain-containing protein
VLVRDVMTKDPEMIHPDATLQEAARKMKELDVGVLPVAKGDTLFGMLTDRDITVRATADGRDPKATRVREVLTDDVVFVYDDQDVKEASRIMQEKQIRRLIVVDREKRLAGIVSLGDLAVDTGFKRMAGETLQRVSEPAEPKR